MAELAIMARGRQRHDWDQMASLMALTANCHRDPKKTRPFVYTMFHPFEEVTRRPTKGIRIGSGNIRILKKLFVDSQQNA